jgi:hypothetical protein
MGYPDRRLAVHRHDGLPLAFTGQGRDTRRWVQWQRRGQTGRTGIGERIRWCRGYCCGPWNAPHRQAAGGGLIVLVLLSLQPGDQPVEAVVATPLGQPGRQAVGARRPQRAHHRPAHQRSENHHRDQHDQQKPAPPPAARRARSSRGGHTPPALVRRRDRWNGAGWAAVVRDGMSRRRRLGVAQAALAWRCGRVRGLRRGQPVAPAGR